jgi:hypothetical protein
LIPVEQDLAADLATAFAAAIGGAGRLLATLRDLSDATCREREQ